MTAYRRARVAGATWFFTVNLADRSSALLTERIDDLCAALLYVQGRHPFVIDAMVVLPDHLHAVWTLPPDDSNFSMRWRLLKGFFSRRIPHGEWLPREWATMRRLKVALANVIDGFRSIQPHPTALWPNI